MEGSFYENHPEKIDRVMEEKSFALPAGISYQRTSLPSGREAYIFYDDRLGELDRLVILLQQDQYYRFNASLRDTVEGLFYRGLEVSHETVRQWVYKFGSLFASVIKKKQPKRGDKWHLDEVCLTIKGKRYWLWRAIDQEGYELDVLLQPRRNTKAALRFFKKLLKGLCYVPRVIITDKLRSYKASKKKVLKTTEHRSHKRLNNRIEASHQATRIREKIMRGFKSPKQAQLFLSTFGVLRNHFKIGLYKLSATDRREKLREVFDFWSQVDKQPFCV